MDSNSAVDSINTLSVGWAALFREQLDSINLRSMLSLRDEAKACSTKSSLRGSGDSYNEAIYHTRSPIPSLRGVVADEAIHKSKSVEIKNENKIFLKSKMNLPIYLATKIFKSDL